MNPEPLVSIIVNNYNYGRFVGEAIESALNQTYHKIEVIVVDDGSSDHSPQVIAGYGERIIPVLKKNGGQASAFNAGFTRSQGEIIIFLDADDLLKRDIVQRVVEVFRNNPDIGGVQYRLDVVDVNGEPTGAIIPPPYLPLPDGEIRSNIQDLLNCSNWSPTSGNAFAASTLRKVLPMPEASFRLSADYYLTRANAFCAPLKSLDDAGGYYRTHSANGYFTLTINLDQLRQRISFICAAHTHIRRFTEVMGIKGYPAEAVEVRDEIFLAQRMISYKLEALQHPIQEDSHLSLCWRGIISALQRPHLSAAVRLVHVFWFIAMLLAPRSLAGLLAEQFFPETRRALNKVLILMQWPQKRVAPSIATVSMEKRRSYV